MSLSQAEYINECGDGVSEETLEEARHALTLWAVTNIAVGKQHLGEVNRAFWGNLVDRLAPVLNLGPHLFENGTMCAVASAAARLLIKPWVFIPILDRWLNPAWIVSYLDWGKIIAQGWGAFFVVLERQLPYNHKVNRTDYRNLKRVRVPAKMSVEYGPRYMASLAQSNMKIWHKVFCTGCWIGEVLEISQPQPLWSWLWNAAQAVPHTFRLRPGEKKLGRDIFRERPGLLCSSVGELHDSQTAKCVDLTVSVTAPFDSDFSALAVGNPDRSIAVCLTGALRALNQSAGLISIRRHLLDALEADVFAYVPVEGLELATAVAQAMFGAVGVVRGVRTLIVMEEWRIAELAVLLGAETVEKRYAPYLGNWRAPLFEEIGGNLFMIYQQAACHKMVSTYEQQRGVAYTYVVWSRLDFHWMADHPPIHKSGLEHTLAVWIPRNEDWWGGGINDRHALLTRRAADIYLTRWHSIVDGTVTHFLEQLKDGVVWKKSSGETMLRRLLEFSNVELWRFDPVAFLLCCEPSPTCLHEQGTDRPGTKLLAPRCAKYPGESSSVLKTISHSTYADLPSSRWANSSSEWIWSNPLSVERNVPTSWGPGDLLGLGSWRLGCCYNPSGPVSCWAWILVRRCLTLQKDGPYRIA